MNKIFSTSSYGNNPRYIVGVHRQYELAKKYYPDWEFRLYVDNKENYSSLCDANIIEVKDGSHGVFWRFMPLFEDGENVTIVRDADGRVTVREQMAVNEWLDTDKIFHIYRDHEAHFQYPIIACAFGLKGRLPDDILNVMKHFMFNTNYYTNDQVFLRDFVFPYIKNNVLIHSIGEGWFGETRNRLKNRYSFCGNGYDENDMPLYASTMAEMTNDHMASLTDKDKFDEGLLV